MTKNKNATRYYSNNQETSVANVLGGRKQSNSGASAFQKGDVVTNKFLIECKTCVKEKESFSIKKEWIEKNKMERFQMRKPFSCICFNFGPDSENYYVIDEKLMKYLCECLDKEDE